MHKNDIPPDARIEEALKEEAPLLKEEEKKAEGLRHQALVRTHLRGEPAPVPMTPDQSGEWANTFEKDLVNQSKYLGSRLLPI